MYGFVFRTNKVEVCGKKCRPIVDMTIVESRHHAITPFLVSDEGEGRGGGSERKRFTDSRLLKWNIGKGKKDIESGKCLRRKRNESVLNDISPSF